MLVIRKPQMDALDAAAERAFITRLVGRVQNIFPDQANAPDSEALKQRVAGAYRRAKRYGLRAKQDVARFVDMDFGIAPGFEQVPGWEWASDILNSADLTGPTKLFRLGRRLEKARVRIYPEGKEPLDAR